MAEQANLRQGRAGENTGHCQEAAEHPRGVDPDQDIYNGEDRAAKHSQETQQVQVVQRQSAINVLPFQQIDDAGNQPGCDKCRNQQDKDIGQLSYAPLIGAAY